MMPASHVDRDMTTSSLRIAKDHQEYGAFSNRGLGCAPWWQLDFFSAWPTTRPIMTTFATCVLKHWRGSFIGELGGCCRRDAWADLPCRSRTATISC
jgi:hypothetical protein